MNRLKPSAAALVDAGALHACSACSRCSASGTRTPAGRTSSSAAPVCSSVWWSAYVLRALRQPVIVVAAAVMIAFLLFGDLLVLPGQSAVRAGDRCTTLAVSAVFGWKQLLTTLPPVRGRRSAGA